ncbi:MAG: ATP-binding cassette domain-containing protein [Bacteroidaceae bacterium]|nr:ATP-binding cassette domain-containing protein [Bacteroidaceae bacterium]
MESIYIKGARVNNLKNIDVEIPRDKLIVVTGVSGSGKSSLAFDTLYAEGQRRYVESLSSYARQFLGRMGKPECDFIKGIPPAIAIEQKVSSRNPRSTVGTSTEIYEYMRMLFARVGRTYSPVSGEEVKKQGVEDVIRCVMTYTPGTRFVVLAPMHLCKENGTADVRECLKKYLQQGFVRIEVDGQITTIEEYLATEGGATPREVHLVIDRLSVRDDNDSLSRLTDSVETAFYEGGGEMMLRFLPAGILHKFNSRFEADGIVFQEPTDQLFAFNSPLGACPECEGFGKIMGIDERLVIPNSALSLYEGCVQCWRGEKMSEWKTWFIRFNSERGFPVHKPYYELTQAEKDWLWHGKPSEKALSEWTLTPEEQEWGLVSIDAFFDMLKAGQYKIQNRVMLARYRGKTTCPKCLGRRLKPEANYVRVAGRTISELVEWPISKLSEWFAKDLTSSLTENEQKIAMRLLVEIRSRLQFLMDVGLPYLTLNRLSNSLSGGESQRINLATSLGSALVGSLYILDEPSIGLHSRDTERLIKVLHQLRDLGNTVVVVEHDEDIMRAADWIIDVGPEAGRLGGQIVYNGKIKTENGKRKTENGKVQASESMVGTRHAVSEKAECEQGQESDALTSHLSPLTSLHSHTLDFLSGKDSIPVPETRRRWNRYIEIRGARANNLKGIDVRFPLNVMTCVTGVSGSGKSSLVRDILFNAIKRNLDEVGDRPGEFASLEGDTNAIQAIEFVDQNPIGKSSRSNPVTYVKAWDEIRKLFAQQALAQQMGFTAAYFSFNASGGRCEECNGEGTVTVEMQFMADLVLECESCHGKRFKQEVLEVRFHEKNVYDILDMTINQAIEFFAEWKEKKIVRLLKPLQDVGLGYIKLGQSSSTLSGGENQRVKLAYYLGMDKHVPTMFIFDEPTTGLHFHDIKKLLAAFNALLAKGHTIVIIEHNLDVIKCADHIIDIGPEGGEKGGHLVACGTPEEVVQCKQSYTARFLKEKLG